MSASTARTAVATWLGATIDCHDPERLAAFWADILGMEIETRLGDPPQFVYLAPLAPGRQALYFQRVPEEKTVKNRVHLDVLAADLEQASARVEGLGGRRRDDHDFHDLEHDEHWRRMADPEGNEFCLVFEVRAADE